MRRLSTTVTEWSMRGAARERRRREEEAVSLRAASSASSENQCRGSKKQHI